MATDSTNPLGYFFPQLFGRTPAPTSYEALAARRKIAEAMMARQTKMPQNIGQGLTAIGDAIGDRGYYNNVLADEEAAKGYESKATSTPAPPPSSYVPYSPSVGAATPPPQKTSELTTDAAGETAVNTVPPPAPPAPVAAAIPADTTAQAGGDPWTGRSNAIAGIESGGNKNPYALIGAQTSTGDRAIGKYQVMGKNVPEWTQAALGAPMTAEQFRANPDAQEAVFKHRFGQYVNKYGEEGAARAWFGGEKGMRNLAGTDVHGRLTVASYGQDYLKRLGGAGGGAAPGPRDQIAAAMTPPAGPMTPDDTQQEATLNDVVGMQKAPTAGYAFPPTADARTGGDVQSDAAPLGIRPTGGLGGDSPVAASVADTVQARGDAIKGPTPITPEPNPPPAVGQIQTAQVTGGGGGSAVAGPTATDVSRAPQLGGPPQIQPLGDKPVQPQLLPTENARTQHFEAIAADPRLSPTARQQAATQAQAERAQVNSFNAQKIQEYNFYLQRWLDAKGKREDPATQLDVYQKQMQLTPDQINDLTPQEKAVLGDLPPGVRVYKDALGKLQKIVGPQSVTVDQRGESEEAKVSGQLAAKRADATIQAGEAADETKFNIARARAMLDQIKTGAFQDGKTSIAAIGRGLGVSDDFLVGIGLDPKGIGTKQAFQAVVNELAMGKIGAGGMPSNNFSEGDRKFLEKTVISLGDDDEANRIKLAAADLVADRKREKATAWGDWQDDPEQQRRLRRIRAQME